MRQTSRSFPRVSGKSPRSPSKTRRHSPSASADCRSASDGGPAALLGVRRALSFLRDLARAHPTDRAIKLELAFLLGLDGQREEAIAELQALTAVAPRLCSETVEHSAARLRAQATAASAWAVRAR